MSYFKRIPKIIGYPLIAGLVIGLVIWVACLFAANIDATNKWSYGENIGWQNWAPTHGNGITIESTGLTGYLWVENIGWIKLDYDGIAGAANTSATNWGVTNDGIGNLAGYAWGENVGWINFHPSNSQVIIDGSGNFSGYAWGENVGWIKFTPDTNNYIGVKALDDFTVTDVSPAGEAGENLAETITITAKKTWLGTTDTAYSPATTVLVEPTGSYTPSPISLSAANFNSGEANTNVTWTTVGTYNVAATDQSNTDITGTSSTIDVFDITAPNAPTIGSFTATGGTVVAATLNNTNTGFTVGFTSPAAEFAGTAHLYVGGADFTTPITTAVTLASTAGTLTGTSTSITELGADGAKALTVVIVDAASNIGAASTAVNITKDITAPNAPVFGTFTALNGTVVANTLNNTNTGFTLSFTSPATEFAGTAHLYVGGVDFTTPITTAVTLASTAGTLTGTSTSITELGADGAKVLTVKIIDAAGNVGAAATGASIVVTHTAGTVAPVTKTVTYRTVTTSLSGASQCWIAQNLGADQQATSATDATEASAGWYWEFNRMYGFKHDGTTFTGIGSNWTTTISQNSNWTVANDPCDLLLGTGTGWRLPTNTEWSNADANGVTGGWDNYTETFNDVLKLHAAGYLYGSNIDLYSRGVAGYYWSSTQSVLSYAYRLAFDISTSSMVSAIKASGSSVRCLNAVSPTFSIIKDTIAPNAPTIGSFTATVGTVVANTLNNTNTGFTLTFTSPATEYAGTAHLYAGGNLLTTDITTAVSAASTQYTLTGNAQSITDLGADGSKALTVKIIDAAGNVGAASSAANITKDTTAPTAPTSVTFTPVDGTVTANTLNNTNTNFTATAVITAGEATGGSAELLKAGASFSPAITDTSILVGDVSVAFTAGFTTNAAVQTAFAAGAVVSVKLTDAAGNSTTSTASNPTITVDYTAPTAPTDLSATTVTVSSINLSWTASTDSGGSGVAGYKIERAPDSSGVAGTYAQIDTSVTNSYSDTTLPANTKYWYRVRAYDVAGNNSNYTEAQLEIDYMEYSTDALAQAAYVTYDSNIVTGGTASADTEYSTTYAASMASDGDLGTRWISTQAAFPHWWKYDLGLGVTKTVLKLRLYIYADSYGNTIKDFTLQGSNDDSSWTTVYTGLATNATTPGWQEFTFTNNTAYRYYKLNFTSSYCTAVSWETTSSYLEIQLMQTLQSYYSSNVLTAGTASADTYYDATYVPSNAVDGNTGTRWNSTNSAYPHWWKYDLGAGVTKTVINLRIYTYWDSANSGVKNFTLQGSNNNIDWTTVYTGLAANSAGWKEFTFSNSTAYRYYKLNFADTYRADYYCQFWETEMGEYSLRSYSEATIKTQGTYALKGVAVITSSLNNILTKTFVTNKDLIGVDNIKFDIRASRIGSNIKIGIRDTGGTTTEITPNITSADTFQTVTWDISMVTTANKDAINNIIVTITNADATNTFYIDNMFINVRSVTTLSATPAITSPADGTLTNDSTPTITGGSTTPSATVKLYDAGTQIAVPAAIADASGNWTFGDTQWSSASLSEGTHTITARALNSSGVESPDSNAVSITVDATAPNAPTIGSFTATAGTIVAATLNNTNTGFTVGFTSPAAEFAGTAHLYVGGADFTTPITTAVTLASTAGTLTGTSTSITELGADGAKALTVVIVDAAGNISTASAAANITKDVTAPNAPTIGTFTATVGTVVANTLNNTNTGFTLTFTSPATEFAGTAHLYAADSLLTTDITVAVSAASTQYTLTGNAQSITDLGADGAKALTVKIIDSNGSIGTASVAANITLDTTAPNAPTIGSFTATVGTVVANTLNNTNTGFTLTFTSPATEFAGTAHLYAEGSLLTTDITVAVSAASTQYTLTGNAQSITDLGADGAKALTVKIIDSNGSVSTASSAANITKDVTPPNAPTGVTIASGSGWNANYISNTNKAAVKVSGAKSADTIQIKIDIDDEDTFTDPKTTTLSSLGAVTTYADAEATGIDVTTATALADGNIAIRITASDTAGSAATQTVLTGSATFKKDIIVPTAAITYSDADGVVKQGDSLTITATFSESMAESPVPNIAISGANTLAATNMTRTDATNYTYIHTVGAGNGTSTVSLSVGTDLAGNVITATPTSGANFTVDNTAPQVAVTIANEYYVDSNWVDGPTDATIHGTFVEAGGLVATSGLQVSVMRDEGAAVYYWDGSDWDATTAVWNNATQGTGAWTYTLDNTELDPGRTYEVKAKATDKVGNETISTADRFVYIPILKVTRASGSGDVTAGSTVELTITAVDYLGTTITSYSGSKSLVFSGPGNAPNATVPTVEAVNIGSTTTVSFTSGISGANLATLIPYKAQSVSVDVQDNTYPAINSTASDTSDLDLIVVPAATSKMLIVLPGQSFDSATGTATGSATSRTAGTAFNAFIYALDQYKNVNTNYAGAKTLTWVMDTGTPDAPDATADVYPASLSFASGQVSGSITLYRAQDIKLRVTETGQEYNQVSSIMTVNPKPAVSVAIATPLPSTTALAGDAFSAQPIVNVKDIYGNICTNESTIEVTVDATSSNSGAASTLTGVLSGTKTIVVTNGVVTFSGLSFNRPEDIYLKFTSGSFTPIYSAKIAVTANEAVYFKITGTATVMAGVNDALTITAYDKKDNVATTLYTGTKTLVFTGDTGPNTAPSDGTYILAHIPTIGTTAFSSKSATVNSVTFTQGVATLNFKGYKVESFLLNVADGAVSSSAAYANASGISIAITPDSANYFKVTATTGTMTAGSEKELTVTAYDQYANTATGYSGTKAIVLSGPAAAPDGTVATVEARDIGSSVNTTFANGVSAAGALTLKAYKVESTTVDARTDDSTINSSVDVTYDLDLTISLAALHHLKVRTSADEISKTMKAGNDDGTVVVNGATGLELKVSAFDTYDNPYTTYTGLKNLTFSGPATIGIYVPKVEGVNVGTATETLFTNGVSNSLALTFVPYKAETVSLDVSDGTVNSTGAAAYDLDVVVNGGTAAALSWDTTATVQSHAVVNALWSSFKINVADTYGNATGGGSAVTVGLTTGGGTGTFTNATVTPDANGAATFSSLTYNTAETIIIKGTAGALITPEVDNKSVHVEAAYKVNYTLKDSITTATLPLVTLTITGGVAVPTQSADGEFKNISVPYNAAGYTFEASKEGYVTDSQTKTPSSSEDGLGGYDNTITWTSYMTSIQESLADYKVLSSFVYVEPDYETDGVTLKSATDKLNIRLWLERRGQIIVNTAINTLQSAKIEVYDDTAGTWTTISTTTSTWDMVPTTYNANLSVDDMSGTYQVLVPHITTAGTGKLLTLTAGKTYFARCSITWGGTTAAVRKTYVAGTTFTVTITEKLSREIINKLGVPAGETLVSKIDAQSELTRDKVSEVKSDTAKIVTATETTIPAKVAEVKTETAKILTAAETTIPTKVDEARTALETEVQISRKSEILNRENTVRLGQAMTIRYRTYTGLSPSIDVYDASNVLKVDKAAMTEIGTTGIYEKTITFESAWGRGDFSIVCSESTKGTMDAMTVSVLTTDMEQVYGQVSSILGNTSGISGLRTVADSLNNQFAVIESVLSRVGKNLVDKVKEAASSALGLESIFTQLSNVAKQVKQISGEAGINLEKLYQVSVDKKQDIDYLKNKTQQLKASVEMSTKMVDNIANKPITQTWYEYKK